MDWNEGDDFDEEEYADLYADEDEAAELDLQQDIESEPESVDLSRFESSAEKNVFSRRNRIWIRRAVSKPRRHRKSDEKGDWSEAAFPDSLEHFRDQQRNQEAFEALRSSARDKEVRNFLICGPRGSGKTAACCAYVKDFARPDADPKAEGARRRAKKLAKLKMKDGKLPLLRLTQDDVRNAAEFEAAFAKFVRMSDRDCGDKSTKFVILDGLDQLLGKEQQLIYKILKESHKKVGFLLTGSSERRILDKFKKKCELLHMKSLDPRDALDVFLGVAQDKKVGFDRPGACMLYRDKRCADMSLGLALRMLQQCFVKWDFISEMNVTKEFCPESFTAPKTIQAGDAMGVPAPRCPICTLPMPCAHCDEQELASQGLERREELPRYDNALACPCFVKFGYCRVFNEFGHCSLDHPRDRHDVIKPPLKCPQCTMVWPCRHCNFTRARDELLETVKRAQKWFSRYNKDKVLLRRAADRYAEKLDEGAELEEIDFELMDDEAEAVSQAAEEAQDFYDTELCTVEEEYRAFTDCMYSLHRVVGDKINSFLPVISKEVAAKKTIHSDAMLRMQLEYLCYIDQDPPKPTTPKTTIRLSRTARAIRSFSPSRQGTPGAPAVSWD